MGVWVGPGVCGGWLYSMGGAEGGGGAPFTDISVYGSILTDPQSVRRTHPTKSTTLLGVESPKKPNSGI